MTQNSEVFLTISKKNKSPAFENIFQICFTQPKQMGFDEYVYQVSCQLNKNCCFERVFKSMAFLLLQYDFVRIFVAVPTLNG